MAFCTPVTPARESASPTGGAEACMRLLPRVARTVSSDPEAYVYLAESIRAWPDQDDLARQIEASGWSQVKWRNLTGGIVALHAAVKPPIGLSV